MITGYLEHYFILFYFFLHSANIFLCFIYIIREDEKLFHFIKTFRYCFNFFYLIFITLFLFINVNGNQIPTKVNRYDAVVNESLVLFIFFFTWFTAFTWNFLLKYIDYEVFIQKKPQTKNIIQLLKTNINNVNIKEIKDLFMYNENNYKIKAKYFNLTCSFSNGESK